MPNRWLLAAALVAGSLGASAGCKNTAKHDNPVMHNPPRRLALNNDEEVERQLAEAAEADSDVALASSSDSGRVADETLFGAQVLVRVNGSPIFASEVLERYGDYLRQAQEKMDPGEYVQLRDAIIGRDLRNHVERKLLVGAMKQKLKPEQITAMDQYLDKMFDKEIDRLKLELGVNTRTELELELAKRGTSLDEVRKSFGDQRIAMEYLGMQAEKPKPVTRQMLIEYYREHPEAYRVPATIGWREIRVSFDGPASKEKAAAKIAAARRDLAQRKPFADVVREYSDGPTAEKGGVWESTRKGSLTDQTLEDKLFDAPVKRLSDVYQGPRAFHVFEVTSHQPERLIPFEDVQDEIRTKLQESKLPSPKVQIDELMAKAIIEADPRYAMALAEPEQPDVN